VGGGGGGAGGGQPPHVAELDFERPESLAAIAKRLIRTQIVTGELDSERIYSVPLLAAALGVSATPVREAIRELTQEGLVEVVANRGFKIASVSKHDLEEIFELRLMLEVDAAGQIARISTPESMEPCLALATQIEAFARSADVARFLDADRAFHSAFLSTLGNRRLVEMVELLRNQVRLYGIPSLAEHGQLEDSVREHRLLIDAVLRHDSAEAVAVMRRHIEHTRGIWAGVEESSGPESPTQ
jgi:DNA-binding GntR family transcriptional regulator